MESGMVKENKYIEYIKEYFRKNLPSYSLAKQNFHGPFWCVEYINEEVLVTISGDIGFQVTVDFFGSKYPLWQYDYSINEKAKTKIDNIEYQLSSLKKLLSELE
jgi:hypothetical protein